MKRGSILTAVVFGVCFVQPPLVEGGAVAVPMDARAVADAAAEEAKGVVYKENEKLERERAAAYVKTAEQAAWEAELQGMEMNAALLRNRTAAEVARLTATQTEQAARDAQSALADAQRQAIEAWQQAERAARFAEARDGALTARKEQAATQESPRLAERRNIREPAVYVPVETDELLRQEAELRQMEEILRNGVYRDAPVAQPEATLDFGAEEAAVRRAYARASDLQKKAEALDAQAVRLRNDTDAKTAAADEAEIKASEANQAALDTEYILKDALETAEAARLEANGAQSYFEEIVHAQENPPPYRYVEAGSRHYLWDSGSAAGYQTILPIYVGYSERDMSYGFAVKRIFSHNRTPGASGKANLFSDASFYLNKIRETELYKINYSFAVNIPTGKASLNAEERRARMNEDLVETSNFGEGWNLTPGIAVTRKIGKEDSWTLGTAYSKKGKYDPTSDIDRDTLRPGGEWQKFLRWQHAGQTWQFVGELIHSSNGTSRVENGETSNADTELETRLTYNRVLSDKESWMAYYWHDRSSSVIDMGHEVKTSPAHYFGSMWRQKLSETRAVRLTFDTMRASGYRYDSLENAYVFGRNKYTFGVGCDFKVEGERTLSLDLQRFVLRDGASSGEVAAKSYGGYNLLLRYSGSF